MRVEHVTVSDVKKKFESLKKGTTKVSAKDLYLKEREERLKKQQEEEEKKEDEEDEETRKLKEMMGFGGFGSAKKKWTVFSQTGATRVGIRTNGNGRVIRFFLELGHEGLVHLQHGRSSLRVPLVHVLLPQNGPNDHACPFPSLRVWNVHDEAPRNHAKVVSPPNEVVKPGDLVESVIHEPLVKRRQERGLLHHHIGLLDVVKPARDQRVMVGAIGEKPLLVQIVLRITETPKAHVCRLVLAVQGAHLALETGD